MKPFIIFILAQLFLIGPSHAGSKCEQLFSEESIRIQHPLDIWTSSANQNKIKIQSKDLLELEQLKIHDFNDVQVKNKFIKSSEARQLIIAIYFARETFRTQRHTGGVDGPARYIQELVFKDLENLSVSFSHFDFSTAAGQQFLSVINEVQQSYMALLSPRIARFNLKVMLKMAQIEKSAKNATYVESIYREVSNYTFSRLKNFHDESQGDLYVRQLILKMAGLPYEKMIFTSASDFRLIVHSTESIPVHLGGTREHEAAGGFFYELGHNFKIGKNKLEINTSRKVKNLSINLRPTELRAFLKPTREFNSSAMWADKKLVGAIFIGQDMRDRDALAAEYQAYYKTRGFKFARPYRLDSFSTEFPALIVNGTIDYILKEDNGSGRFSPAAMVLEGVRISRLGEEKVYIYISEENTSPSEGFLLSPEALIPLVKIRKAAELVYVNSTCFSISCFASFASALSEKKMTYVAPNNLAETFTNEKSTALLHIIDGIRTGKTFAEIKKMIKQTKVVDAETDASDNVYVFPDAASLKSRSVLERFRGVVEFQFQDANQRPLRLEEIFGSAE